MKTKLRRLYVHPQLGKIAVLLCEDWYIYVSDLAGLVWAFNTEIWPEWLGIPYWKQQRQGTKLMLPFMVEYTAERCAHLNRGYCTPRKGESQCTRDEFETGNSDRWLTLRLPDVAKVVSDNEHFLTTPVCVEVRELAEESPDRRDFGHTHCALFRSLARFLNGGVLTADAAYFYTPRTTVTPNPYHPGKFCTTPQGWSLGCN